MHFRSVDRHRHAAVRAELTGHPAVALRLMVAQAIAGSPLWNVRVEPQSAKDDDVRESVEVSRAEAVFDEKRRAVLALLGFDAEEPTVTGGNPMPLANLFQRMLDLPDRAVMDVIAIVMGETMFGGRDRKRTRLTSRHYCATPLPSWASKQKHKTH